MLIKTSIEAGEYSCRCHGKRVISAPSKPLKLKLAGGSDARGARLIQLAGHIL